MSHTYGLAIILTISTNLTQYVLWKSGNRRGSHWNRYGPTYLLLLAIPLTTIDTVRHTILDNGFKIGEHLSMYKRDCSAQYGIPDFGCLSTVGWIVTIFCTYTGYLFMIVGMLWAVDFKQKLVAAFRQVRQAQRRAKERQQQRREQQEQNAEEDVENGEQQHQERLEQPLLPQSTEV